MIKSASLRRVAGAAVVGALAFSAASANAADIYEDESLKDMPTIAAPAYFTWQGAYIGAHVGYAWTDIDVTDVDGYYNGASWSFDADDWIYGGQIGYNWQRGNLVIGLEADLGYFGLDGAANDPTEPDLKVSADGGLYGTLTGRLGYAMNRTLLYVKGGAAFINADLTVRDDFVKVASEDKTLWGYTIGAGVEHAIDPNWTVKVEYLYFDFEDATVRTVDDFRWDADLDAHTVKLGVNYKFGGERYDSLK